MTAIESKDVMLALGVLSSACTSAYFLYALVKQARVIVRSLRILMFVAGSYVGVWWLLALLGASTTNPVRVMVLVPPVCVFMVASIAYDALWWNHVPD